MTKLSGLLFKYLIKEFLAKFFLFFFILIGIAYLFDTVELIRRASGHDNVSITDITTLAFYKLPDIGQQILPFITLFAAIATFRNLSERHELVTLRSAGLSVWQFIIPVVTITFVLSLTYLTIIHPLSSIAMTRYESLQNFYFGDGVETVTIIDDGLWLRQEDNSGSFILKAETLDAKNWIMANVSVFFFDENNTHLQRIDAKNARLEPETWVFERVSLHKTGEAAAILPSLSLKTSLTTDTIAESFSNPQTISFWRMPFFIKSVAETGLDTTDIRAHYQSLLSQPFLLVSMIFMAAAISLRTERAPSLLPIIVSALGFGFVAFFLSGFLKALSLGHEIPIFLGIWSAPLLIFLTAVTLLTRLEDG